MKRIIIIVFCLMFLAQLAFADATSDKIKRTEAEIQRLEIKLKTTTSPQHRQLIISTINSHKSNLARLKKIETEKPKASKRQLVPKVGLSGGATLLGADFSMPVGAFRLKVGAGYGLGSEYNVTDGRIGIEREFRIGNIGIAGTYADYTKKVEIPVGGIQEKGSSFGGAIYLNRRIMRNLLAQVGYSTNLGILAELGFVLAF